MENNNSFKVRCIGKADSTESATGQMLPLGPQPIVGNIYQVVDTIKHRDLTGYALAEFERIHYYCSSLFERINPYSNSVSLELANEAIKENIEVDVPIREVVTRTF
jgi:hypothetical protein